MAHVIQSHLMQGNISLTETSQTDLTTFIWAPACWQACFFHWKPSSQQLQTLPNKSKTTY